MKKVLFVDAVGMIDTDLLESYVAMDQRLRSHQIAKKRKSKRYLVTLLAAALAMLLCVALLVTSLPLIYVFNAEKINTAVSEGVENILFPLDKEPADGEAVNTEDLLINWVEWKFAEEFFGALGAGTKDSVIDQMQAMQSGGIMSESMQSLGDFLAKLYEYYLKHRDESEQIPAETEEESTEVPEETTEDETHDSIPSSVVTGAVSYVRDPEQDYWVVESIENSRELNALNGIAKIADTIYDMPVKVIGKQAAYNNDQLKAVHLPDTIVSIEESAFNNCINLAEITLSNNLESIGDMAFVYCGIELIVIPDSVQSIGQGAFSYSRLRSVNLPNGITEISQGCFSCCSSLSEIIIPDTCTRISNEAFYLNGALQSIDLPDQLREIGAMAFAGSALESVDLPQSVTSIGEDAFNTCRSLVSVTLSDGLEAIPDRCFHGCEKLRDIKLPGACTTIDIGAFNGCESLEGIDLPDSIVAIKDSAFGGCTSLNNVVFPKNLKSLGGYAFAGCISLETVILPEGVEDIGAYGFQYCSALNELSLPSTLKTIGMEAFVMCTSLASVEIPDGIEEMGERAFGDCSSLQSAYVPAFLQEYEGPAELFMGCTSLKEVTFGAGFDGWDLCTGMFTNTGLVEIRLPDTVDMIDSRVFQNCANLETVYLSKAITQIHGNAFKGCPELKAIYYPGSVADFQATVKVFDYKELIGIPIICTDGEYVFE
jgi:hypothetical protein